VVEYSYPKAVIKVPRRESNQRAAKLLSDFPIVDLNIEEPPIEDIIREVFTGKDVA
jgi:ABC-2 type transport system ATP-binding protein